jgi:uncharacterized protein (DUF885 family)
MRTGLRTLLVGGCLAALVAGAAEARSAERGKLDAFIASARAADLSLDPTRRTQVSRTGAESAWTPTSDAYRETEARRLASRLEQLPRAVDRRRLNASDQNAFDIYRAGLEADLLEARTYPKAYFLGASPFNVAQDLPGVLMGSHAIQTEQDARNYIARLRALPAVLEGAVADARARQARGVTMIRSAFSQSEAVGQRFAAGAPCAGEGENPLWSDFQAKVKGAGLSEAAKENLLIEGKAALSSAVCPAYGAFATQVAAMEAGGRIQGLWSTPEGDRLYADLVELSLTTRADPNQVHEVGLREVAKTQAEIEAMMRKVGFLGDLAAFNAWLQDAPEVSLPNTEAGRAAYVAKARALVEGIHPKLPAYFEAIPKTPLQVEPTTHDPSGAPDTSSSYYTPGRADGSKAATYHLGVPKEGPIETWSLATTAYHEGLPGHHLQTAIAAEQGEGESRRFYPAYSEGWGLYAEALAAEMGGYDGDDYARIGWLQQKLTRAVRVVVDTGLNAKRWTPEQASAYQIEHMGREEGLRRFLNWPGQGLAYYWGYLEFVRLRERAEAELGERFDVRRFHTVVLKDGPAPFSVLERQVDAWIAAEKGGAE